MFDWLTEEPYTTMWISLAAIATIIGVLYAILRPSKKDSIKTIVATKKSTTIGKVDAVADGESKQTVISGPINVGITLEQHEAALFRQEQRIRSEIKQAVENKEREKRTQLEIELSSVTDRILNLQKSFEEEQKRRVTVLAALDELKGEQPSAQIDRAKQQLIAGDPVAAEEIFDNIIEIGSPLLTLAYYQSGQIAEGRVDYFKAITQYRKAVNLEPNNPDYLLAAGTLARTLGLYQESLPWLEKLVSVAQSNASEELKATAQNELAFHYKLIAQYEKAEPLYIRALEIKEQSLGEDHPSVAKTLNNLALLYKSQGLYEKAEPLYLRALKIKEQSLGEDHPSVATTLNNLAGLYKSQGLYEKVETLYLRALEINEQSLGKDHPSVATTLNNLALLYDSQGLYEKAEPLYLRDLEISEKALGKDHPSVATTLNNLALLYDSQGLYEKAEPLYQRALEILKAKFPVGHPNIETCQSNYDKLKRKMADSSD
ncbi:MAG: tetratricopeptide repeat protein [Candidatus Marinimicrobia bacterium]|nr:tetratricopeptide repeat protein [Candidatus Neomarinimicrobiota bacterium]